MADVRSVRWFVEVCYCRRCGSVWRESTHLMEEIVAGFPAFRAYPCEFCRAIGHRATFTHVEHYTTIMED